MTKTFVSHNNIVSALGFNSTEVVDCINNEVTGLKAIDDKSVTNQTFYSSLIDKEKLHSQFRKLTSQDIAYTPLEQMMISSLHDVIKSSDLKLTERVGLIISTTKGNIDALDAQNGFDEKRAYLSELGKAISSFFNFKNEAIVVSNACVSGALAIAIAKRYITQGLYDHVFITSGDLVSPFTLSGFSSFQALSDDLCKPYDTDRKGINIGEVAASVLITNSNENLSKEAVEILGEGSCNDANHISGPSRTGEGLYRSMISAFKQAKIDPNEVDYISAHGTATVYNDEMEAIAFNRMQLQDTPVNSLKGYFGHTLGASGLLETIVGMHSLKNNTLYTSLGFETLGVTQPINVITRTRKQPLNTFLKTASGFGGCNTALLFRKVE
ncbi:beta-ketoacyl-[acyl-carrier-protein] synthase family protein [Seonamhaeicola marinus]|uniref:Beta-ketoacyl synthase n=1 Tax=Seonamhaeicola marinus TaxID=1912246 RepID=A0A5D0HRG3_9FLAO|nr:beta-ketoacyl synthase N-terminal-like domain-containing protein [Seonamhaeicola marinus]TYA73953.1 beta-ketoacyl synthase [Seonamhaeicola marinus]